MPDIVSKSDLIKCKKDLLDDLELASISEEYSAFTEENFINTVTELLSDAGIYEDIEIKQTQIINQDKVFYPWKLIYKK